MDMEIEFFYGNSADRNPKLLMDHIRRMASGEAPFFSTTLSLVYDKLVENSFGQPAAPDRCSAGSAGTGNQSIAGTSTIQTQDPPSSVNSPSSPNTHLPRGEWVSQQAPSPEPEPIPLGAVWLRCFQCHERARLRDLYEGLRCPQCPSRSIKKGKPFMRCPACNMIRTVARDTCIRYACQARFV